MIKNISVTPLLTESLIYSDFPLPASLVSDAFSATPVRQELGSLHNEHFWMHSLVRNPHYNIKLQRSCPQGQNMLPKGTLSWQAILRGQKWQCRRQLLIFVSLRSVSKGKEPPVLASKVLSRKGWAKGVAMALSCGPCHSWVSRVEHFKTVPFPEGNQAWKIAKLQTLPSAGSPQPPAPWPGGGTWKPRAQHETREEINPCKSWINQDKADTGVHTLHRAQWRLLNTATIEAWKCPTALPA